MSRMKFINDSKAAVEDALNGFKYSYPAVFVDSIRKIVMKNEIPIGKVCLLSGGGSGHEPFSIGFVGNGMLSGAIAGLVFASPPTVNILTAIRTLSQQNGNSGVLVIVMNYSGDILNFGLAVEHAKTLHINVEMVIIDEDCARSGVNLEGSGKRGMCGNCFIFKIAGSMAQSGYDLVSIRDECNCINQSMGTIGVAISSCTVPGVGPLFKLNSDEIEIGLGVHGEAGMYRAKMPSLESIVHVMITKIMETLNLSTDNKICVAINNLGSVSQLEMGVICHKVNNFLIDLNISVSRIYCGSLMTSLDMTGFQISILNITDNLYWLQHLDRSTDAPNWPATCVSVPLSKSKLKIMRNKCTISDKIGPKLSDHGALLFEKYVRSTLNAILQQKKRKKKDINTSKNENMTQINDESILKICESILKDMSKLDMKYPASCFYFMSEKCQSINGASGSLFGFLLMSCSRFLITSASTIDWLKMWKTSLNSVFHYCKVKITDQRAGIDILLSACERCQADLDENDKSVFAGTVNEAALMYHLTRSKSCDTQSSNKIAIAEDLTVVLYQIIVYLESIAETIRIDWRQ